MTDSTPRSQLAEIVARRDVAFDVARAALLVACEAYPDLDIDAYLARLDALGERLSERLAGRAAAEDRLAETHAFLFGELGFRGNADDYYDPRNSFLNDVLDRCIGIPITLSTVYLEVTRRAGLHVEGVGLPGHFIVRVAQPGFSVLVDPFHSGELLTQDGCQRLLERLYGTGIELKPWMLEACEGRALIGRLLRNLKVVYMKRRELERALGITELALVLDPSSGEDLRDRGLLYGALDCYGLAVRDLETYVSRARGTPGTRELRARLAELRRRAAMVH